MKCFNCKLEIIGITIGGRLCWHCALESVNASGDDIICPACRGVGRGGVFKSATKTRKAGFRPGRCETCRGAKRIAKDQKVCEQDVYSFAQNFPDGPKHKHPCPHCRAGLTPCYARTSCTAKEPVPVVCMDCVVKAARRRMFVSGYHQQSNLTERGTKMSETKNEIVAIYADGGVIRRNPSTIGGTWAWCGVNADGERVIEKFGAVPATPSRPISNNHTEQIAITLALEAMPDGWSGTVYSDSMIALGRVFKGWRETNLPKNISDRSRNSRARLGVINTVLLQGHPTKEDLKNGIGKKRGLPVSIHNVKCDELCGLAAKEYLASLNETIGV